ncbi:hypothetical protein AOXY_G12198 [Acipenser oxyrinchus oxyrinchus]|uniref:Uncharacterized protein n=1 Tax=Acipenser oxyrinchus oxyrinchus TaxID=40147 RepID=A0AAD8G3K9_ACIOX|nr:hypothetical protein AOXY_G12198 [Acipenser oxyrinchus oxyrinchus]
MLAEGFIRVIGYQDSRFTATPMSLHCQDGGKDKPNQEDALIRDFVLAEYPACTEATQAEKNAELPPAQKSTDSLKQPSPLTQRLQVPPYKQKVSCARPIPASPQDSYNGLELYRSWSCTSICKNYPDLQIRGDHVGNVSSVGSGLAIREYEYETCSGPLLQSGDLEDLELEQSTPNHQEDELYREEPSDEGYLALDRSITLQQEPLSNSMLNSYLEKKVLEVYKQYLEDSLTKCASPSHTLAPSFVMQNVNQISMLISQEKKMETSKVRSMVLNYLFSAISGNSSEFSTPNLHFSNLEQKRYPEPSKKKTMISHQAL